MLLENEVSFSNNTGKKIQDQNAGIKKIHQQISERVFGAEDLSTSLIIAILSGGHVLLEGLPGLAKTLLAETFSQLIDVDFKRIQFTPDLLPADLTGGEVLNMKEGTFQLRQGPVFTNLLLADEINRAPAKVQSALLEAMAEKKVTIARQTILLNEPFMVLATQNPIEQEGTYPLPEAQTDRFMFKVLVDYPGLEDERRMLKTHGKLSIAPLKPISNSKEILKARALCEQVYVDEKLETYIIDLVRATRSLKDIDESLHTYVDFGASPRASPGSIRSARLCDPPGEPLTEKENSR